MALDTSSCIAWIAWNGDDSERPTTDRYRVNWEERVVETPTWREGPQEASLSEALCWARARADRVVLRTPDGEFSAGAVRKMRLPEWDDAETEQ